MSELIKLDETSLQTKVLDLEARLTNLESKAGTPMPDDIKQKLKDVLTWIVSTL